MGLFNKLLLLILVLALASPFILKKPDGTPFVRLQDFLDSVPDVKTPTVSSAPKSLYRWQDEKGNWQYSDHPPENINAEPIQVEDKITSMKTIELPEGYRDSEITKRFDPLDGSGSSLPLSTAPIEKVPEMLDQIENFQKELDDRKQQIDNL